MTAAPRPQTLERTTTANWTLRREIGNALGYAPSPHYDWAYLDGDKWREYPAWDVDLNVAMTLVGDHYFTLNQNPQMEIDFLRWEAKIGLRGTFGRGETPALAICHAYLAYAAYAARPPTADDSGR